MIKLYLTNGAYASGLQFAFPTTPGGIGELTAKLDACGEEALRTVEAETNIPSLDQILKEIPWPTTTKEQIDFIDDLDYLSMRLEWLTDREKHALHRAIPVYAPETLRDVVNLSLNLPRIVEQMEGLVMDTLTYRFEEGQRLPSLLEGLDRPPLFCVRMWPRNSPSAYYYAQLPTAREEDTVESMALRYDVETHDIMFSIVYDNIVGLKEHIPVWDNAEHLNAFAQEVYAKIGDNKDRVPELLQVLGNWAPATLKQATRLVKALDISAHSGRQEESITELTMELPLKLSSVIDDVETPLSSSETAEHLELIAGVMEETTDHIDPRGLRYLLTNVIMRRKVMSMKPEPLLTEDGITCSIRCQVAGTLTDSQIAYLKDQVWDEMKRGWGCALTDTRFHDSRLHEKGRSIVVDFLVKDSEDIKITYATGEQESAPDMIPG